jgi:hypothetical protein
VPYSEVCVIHGVRVVLVARVILSACVFGGFVAFGLVAVPIGQVVHDSCGVHGNCESCEHDTCVSHLTVDFSKGELVWGVRSVFVA